MPDFAEQLVMSDDAGAEQPALTPEQPAPSTAPVSDDRPRDEAGRFATKTKDEIDQGVKQEAAQPSAPAVSEPPADAESPHVPRTALLDERRKRQALEAELAELRKPKAEQAPQTSPHPQNPSQSQTPKVPDFSFDPSQFEGDPEALFEARLHKNKMDMSTVMAVQQFGEGTLAEAWAAFDQAATMDPRIAALSVSLLNHPHPMGQVVNWYKEHKEVQQLTEAGGLEKLRERLRAELLQEMQGTTPAAPAITASAPTAVPMPRAAAPATPPSLARGGAGHGNAPERLSDNDVFEKIFDKSKRLSRNR